MVLADIEYGSPVLPERFWDKVYPEPNTGCWLWGASTNNQGYSQFKLDRRMVKGHRVAYKAAHGSFPDGDTDHRCRQRSCVNPAHLEDVPHRENVLRGEGHAAVQARRTHCLRAGHPLSGDNLYVIPTTGSRQCRACKRTGRTVKFGRSVGVSYQAGGSVGRDYPGR